MLESELGLAETIRMARIEQGVDDEIHSEAAGDELVQTQEDVYGLPWNGSDERVCVRYDIQLQSQDRGR